MFPRFMAHFLWVCFSIYALCLKVELIDTVQTGNLENVRLLVEQGADLDQVDSSGWSPLFWASYGGQLEIAQYLVEQGSTMDKATNYGAASNGHLEVVRYLLEQGADKEKANQLGWTPLHRAAYMGRLEVAKLLMHYGADVNAKTTLVNCRSTWDIVIPKRSDRPSATSPDVAWTNRKRRKDRDSNDHISIWKH